MKKTIILLAMTFLAFTGFSQDISQSTRKKFSIIFDIYTDIWCKVPENVDVRTINQGVNVAGLYDYRLGKSDLSFAFGIGLGTHNFFSDAMVVKDTAGDSELIKIKTLYTGTDYKNNKISYSYFDIPVEFRLRTKEEFRAAVGFKMGFLIASHSKFKGDDYLFDTSDEIKVKFSDVPNIETFRYGITGRLGWKFINLTAFYSLTGLFIKDRGPELYPVSVGISLMPF